MKTIEVKNQKEFDKIKDDFEGEIRVTGALDFINRTFKNAWINICGSATVKNIYDSATVEYICGSATVKNIYGSATVKNIYDSATVKYICDSVTVEYICGSATVEYICGSAKILLAAGLASFLMVSDYASIKTTGNNIVRHYEEKGIILNLSKNTTEIILKDDKKDIEWFCGNYPIEQKKSKVTLYKAVHKQGKRYFSDWDKSFNYEIGKIIKQECDPDVEEDCSYGIHVSWLVWAVKFGRGWDDMAILECEVNKKDIVVPEGTDGKVRASKVKIVREVPESEY